MKKEKTPKIKKVWTRYVARCQAGQKIMVRANNDMSWSDGRSVSRNVVREMLSNGMLKRLDTDLFGVHDYGQTIGLPA